MRLLRFAALLFLCLTLPSLLDNVPLHADELASFKVADFETEGSLLGVRSRDSVADRVRDGSRDGGHALRWRVKPTRETVCVSIPGVPKDVREFRSIAFRIRTDGGTVPVVHFRLRSGDGVLSSPVENVGASWREVSLLLPEMQQLGDGFDATKVDSVRLVVFGTNGFTLHLDDVELTEAPGGWRWTPQEQVARVFGQKRARKVKQIETDHFQVFTDSSGARRKFPVSLEKTYEFVRKTLNLGEMDGKLPAYIFQNAKYYEDFCVRNGWSRDAAASTAGHANGKYFATYYQSPTAAVVTHELTHSVFHRTMGHGGGSWFQEGVAVYVEEKWQKRSVAATFSPKLRSGKYVPLRELFACQKLIASSDKRGGARTGASMYQQAGAFFEFLLRGPYAQTKPDAIKELAKLDARGDARITGVEKILGKSVDEIEMDWLDWGRKPPTR